jgi:hypothetical protein
MTKQIINQKLLKFFKAMPQTFEIIYTINYKEYIFYERYLDTQIKFFVDEKEYDHVDIDGRCFICKTNKYMFNLYLLLRTFIIYSRIEKQKINEQHVQ